MRYFYDTEFIENGKTIDLISIGIVADDGRAYYAQSLEFDAAKASEWVQEHVFDNLIHCPTIDLSGHTSNAMTMICAELSEHAGFSHAGCPWSTREEIKADILAFMDVEKYGTPELWGYYSAYDHVAFCQLFGTMMDLPQGFPMYTRDIKQWADELDVSQLPEQKSGEHNALDDAKWNRVAWSYLESVDAEMWKALR